MNSACVHEVISTKFLFVGPTKYKRYNYGVIIVIADTYM